MREEREAGEVEQRDVKEAAQGEGGEEGDVGEVPGGVARQVEGGEDDGGAGHSDQVQAKHGQLALKSPHITGARAPLSSRPPGVGLQVPGGGQQEEEDGQDDGGRPGPPSLLWAGDVREIGSGRTFHPSRPADTSVLSPVWPSLAPAARCRAGTGVTKAGPGWSGEEIQK